MKNLDIINLRLHNHHLLQTDFRNPHDVVSYLGAVQAQDYAGAKWSIGMRMRNGTDEKVEKAFNDGTIIRTHIMRPTWHFIAPEDIRSVLALTSPRVHAMNAYMYRKLELDQTVFMQCRDIFIKALHQRYLTRQELSEKFLQRGIIANGQRLAYIIMQAELEGIICSGPRRGKQLTYALLDERVPILRQGSGPEVEKVQRDKTLGNLTLKYFTSHGPAQRRDFTWWSGLSTNDVKAGIDMVKSKLTEVSLEDKTYWYVQHQNNQPLPSLSSLLLSIYDEYTIAYKDRSDLGGERYVEKLLAMGNALTAVIILDGKIVGTWKRRIGKDTVTVNLSPFRKLTSREQNALSDTIKRYGQYLDMSAILS